MEGVALNSRVLTSSPGYFFYQGGPSLWVEILPPGMFPTHVHAMEIAAPQDWLRHMIYICVLRTIDSWSMWLL